VVHAAWRAREEQRHRQLLVHQYRPQPKIRGEHMSLGPGMSPVVPEVEEEEDCGEDVAQGPALHRQLQQDTQRHLLVLRRDLAGMSEPPPRQTSPWTHRYTH